jgi:cytidylate kinase
VTAVVYRVVTISASYGAGGSVIGPAVADALGVPFLDRAVPARVASRQATLAGERGGDERGGDERGGDDGAHNGAAGQQAPGATPTGEQAAVEERTSSLIERIVATFANLPDAFGPGSRPSPEPVGSPDDQLRRETEKRVRGFVAEHGAGVVLGWGATILLPDAFHVRLYGPVERRVEQAMRLEGLDRAEAERHQQETDRIRGQYLRRLHGRDWNDMSLFHLMIDSTALSFEEATRVVVSAANAFWAERAPEAR